jgi:hypothetical protein
MNALIIFLTFVLEAVMSLLGSAAVHAQTTPAPDNFKKAAEYSHSQHGTGVQR